MKHKHTEWKRDPRTHACNGQKLILANQNCSTKETITTSTCTPVNRHTHRCIVKQTHESTFRVRFSLTHNTHKRIFGFVGCFVINKVTVVEIQLQVIGTATAWEKVILPLCVIIILQLHFTCMFVFHSIVWILCLESHFCVDPEPSFEMFVRIFLRLTISHDITQDIIILDSSQREIKVVVRSHTLKHNQKLNCTQHVNNSKSWNTHTHTHTHTLSQSAFIKPLIKS